MISDGASLIDIGAESTRPNATPITPEEEKSRLEPLLSELKRSSIRYSIDTRHPETAAWAIEAGAHWINDVTGLENPKMRKIIAQSGVNCVVMHSLTVPVVPSVVLAPDCDPVREVLQWGENRIRELEADGISREKILFDPGLGFGKSVEHQWTLVRRIEEFHRLGVRLYAGHSRKSFLSAITSSPASDRDPESASLSGLLAKRGVDFVRVHNVGLIARAIRAHQFA
jgi:dihydropteroate synthase